MTFNEDSRVIIPAIVQLTRPGFTYVPKTGTMRVIDAKTVNVWVND
jgi:hypothetical protein